MELILVGGAPLSPETHDFIRVCLGGILIQVRGPTLSLSVKDVVVVLDKILFYMLKDSYKHC